MRAPTSVYAGMVLAAVLYAGSLTACGDDGEAPPELTFTAVTFNSGTTEGLGHDDPPDDGYTSTHAATSDMWYGDGLAWIPAVNATRTFLAQVSPDVIVFQEIFHADECATIPSENHADFFCDGWTAGDATVVSSILGADYQVACNLGKPDKCAAVHKRFGTFRGCASDFCLDGLDGGTVANCGGGSRVGRGVIDLVAGGSITLVNVHGTSGLTGEDVDCRRKQFEQVFVDLGDGAPAANGTANIVMGDLNTDPGRFASNDASAARFGDFAGDGKAFTYISDVGEDAPPSYAGAVNIDHVVSDVYRGNCWVAGVSEGHPDVTDAIYFDHKPIVCTVEGDLPQ